MRKMLQKIFGGLKITWPKLIIFAVSMGLYTALMAMFVPDGNSFHDIAATAEWWVLPAIIIIVNSEKPLEAALKTFVFFLISQPLVYLLQVPFNSMGWGLFGYYKYWFFITLLTFPGAFVGWFIKKDKWYSALILAVMTIFLVYTGVGYAKGLPEHFPNHLLSIIYCFGIIPVFIFAIFKDNKVRILNAVLTLLSLLVFVFMLNASQPFQVSTATFAEENEITFVGEPFVSGYSGSDGKVELKPDGSEYVLELSGQPGNHYTFSIDDDENSYGFEYYYNEESKTVVITKTSTFHFDKN